MKKLKYYEVKKLKNSNTYVIYKKDFGIRGSFSNKQEAIKKALELELKLV